MSGGVVVEEMRDLMWGQCVLCVVFLSGTTVLGLTSFSGFLYLYHFFNFPPLTTFLSFAINIEELFSLLVKFHGPLKTKRRGGTEVDPWDNAPSISYIQ